MKLPLPTLTLALCAAIVSTALSARPGWGGGPGHDGGLHMLEFMADEIGLTIDQEDAINELINESKLSTAVDRERMGQIREELQRLSRADDAFDSGAAAQLADELAEIVSRTALSGAELRWNIRQQLTVEQREHIDTWRGGGRRSPPFVFGDVDPLTE